MELEKFIPLMKVDQKLHQVWGVAAVEEPDRSKEVMDYAASKPNFEAWSAGMSKASNGKSLGNVRSMHTRIAAGRVIDLNFDDQNKRVLVGAEIVDPDEWAKVEKGVYTGFSVGGDYGKRWMDPERKGLMRYEAIPVELSLVDLPCIPGATFEVIKADGARELRKFVETGNSNLSAISDKPETGEGMKTDKALNKAAADPTKAIAMVQALRDEAEQGGDLESAALFTQAIALLIQAGIEGVETPEEEAAETPEQQAAEAALVGGTTGEAETETENQLQQSAKVGKLKKAGRTFSTQNIASMHNVIQSLAMMLAGAGDPVAQKVSECYKAKEATGSAGPTPETPVQPAEAMKAASTGDLEKVLETMTKNMEKLSAEMELLKRQPVPGGPAMRNGGGPAEKTLPGQSSQTPVVPDPIKPKIDELRKSAAVEPDPLKRAEYMRQLFIAEQATLAK